MNRVFNFLGSSGFCPALRRLGRRRRGLQNVRVRSLKTKFRKNVRKSLDLISSLIFASTCSIIYNGSRAREAQANCRKGTQVAHAITWLTLPCLPSSVYSPAFSSKKTKHYEKKFGKFSANEWCFSDLQSTTNAKTWNICPFSAVPNNFWKQQKPRPSGLSTLNSNKME